MTLVVVAAVVVAVVAVAARAIRQFFCLQSFAASFVFASSTVREDPAAAVALFSPAVGLAAVAVEAGSEAARIAGKTLALVVAAVAVVGPSASEAASPS